MKWKVKIGRYAGIDVYVHMTFILLLLWVVITHWMKGTGAGGVAIGILFILAIFGCVTLHEFGHALAARRYGIRTRDIMLLPIGGVARLERMPREPMQEIYVALAGPAVNLIIAGLLYLWLSATSNLAPVSDLTMVSGPLLERLMIVNLILVGFNLIPAFPMDGGRVLRAVLAMHRGFLDATQRAAQIGQGFSFLFGLAGLIIGNPMLVFIAFFIWIGAAQESGMAQMGTAMRGIPVDAAMVTDFRSLTHNDRLKTAVNMTLAGTQTDFPVLNDGEIVGILNQTDLLAGLDNHGEHVTVSTVMKSSFVTIGPDEMLEEAFRKLAKCNCHTIPVVEGNRLVGLLTMNNVGEFVRINSALKSHRRNSDLPNGMVPLG